MGLSKERGLYFQEKWEEMEYRFANIEMKKEIEELKLELSGYRQAILQDKEMLGLKEENEQLHSIIKEVREKLKELVEDDGTFIGEIDYLRKKELLEILDKENK